MDGTHYSILVNNHEAIIEFNNKKGKSNINPIRLVDNNNHTLDSVQLYNGRTYLIEKTVVNDNKTHIINQRSIKINQISE